MIKNVIQRIRKRKRWLIDKKVKKTTTPSHSPFNFNSYFWILCLVIAIPVFLFMALQLNNLRNELAHTKSQKEHFQNLYLTKPTKNVIIRPRVIKNVQKEIIEKKVYVYVRVPVKHKSRSNWKHLPERRGHYIR